MRRLDFTPRARRDIEEIWEYSVDQFGLDRADRYLRDIRLGAQ
jgi:plasmid stabilization system protein ParE